MPNQSSFAAGHVESGPQGSGAPALTEQSVPVELSAAGPSSLSRDGEMARQKSIKHQSMQISLANAGLLESVPSRQSCPWRPWTDD